MQATHQVQGYQAGQVLYMALELSLKGVADQPSGEELERLKELYFTRFPDGRERQSWPGLVYVRVRPTWIRYSDYSRTPPEIIEFNPASPT